MILIKKKITDTTCGFRAFKVNIFKNFKKNFLKKNFLHMVMNISVMEKL